MARKWLNKYRLVVQLLLLLIGLLFVFLPVVVPIGGQWSLVWFSLATSLMAGVLLSLLEALLGTDVPTLMEQRLDFNRQVYDMGLEAIYLHGNTMFLDRFETAHSIDMFTVSARGTFREYGIRLLHALKDNGCRIRPLLADPDNVIWMNREAMEGLGPGSDIATEIKDTIAYLKYLEMELKQSEPQRKDGSLEVRLYPFLPTAGIIILDENIARHTPYLPFCHSIEAPVYDITRKRGGKLFAQYQDTFDRVWRRSRSILKVDMSLPQSK